MPTVYGKCTRSILIISYMYPRRGIFCFSFSFWGVVAQVLGSDVLHFRSTLAFRGKKCEFEVDTLLSDWNEDRRCGYIFYILFY